ncbi:PAS domain-containing protein [Halobellus rufus]|uniref:PAS domain-containing protein n=1 Tax=Halobellus rufus TaxID=1448860 RepID=UPI000678917A|nr:PAS domain-containing protein [Halobellus rufus]
MNRTGGINALVAVEEHRPIDVLHVDDDASFAELTALRLSRDGDEERPEIRVETCTDPTAALGRIDAFDCVVSDYDMPEMDGLELLNGVRERVPRLPFILFTGKGSEEIASDAISAGVTDYLRKGGTADSFDVLANRVRNACARDRAERAVEQSERRLRQVLDRLPQCIFVKDTAGTYRFVNRAGAAGFGRSPKEIEGELEPSVVGDPEVAARFRAEDELVLDTGNPLVVTDQHVDGTSGERVERVVKYPVELSPGGTEVVLGIAEDVTGEHARSEALETVEETLRDLLHLVDEGDVDPPAIRSELGTLLEVVDDAPSMTESVPTPSSGSDG